MMEDAELVRQLREPTFERGLDEKWIDAQRNCAADRIEALIAERDHLFDKLELERALTDGAYRRARKAEAERDAARDAALEESAKMVDVFFGQNAFADADLYKWGTASGAQAIAAAIRAMKGKSHE